MNSLAAATSPLPSLGLIDRAARRLVVDRLGGLQRGELNLVCDDELRSFGQASDLSVQLRVHHPRLFRSAVLGGTLAVAESYIRGDWDCDNLTSLFRIFLRNRSASDRIDSGMARAAKLLQRSWHWLHDNTRAGSRRNIHAHYDLGNEFFRLWLDDTLAYSSGIFADHSSPLVDASNEKFNRVCRKLDLQSSDEVVEIGTGWGGFALHAAGQYGCRVTTTTISQSQYDVSAERVAAAGLGESVTLLKQDYRDLEGRFDKLASIEMIEAVGHRHLDDYFGTCGRLLHQHGSLVLQAIVMPEHSHASYLRSVDFIQRFVFPGGCLPSISAMLEAAGRTTDLRCVHVEDFAPHYAETLRRWRQSFYSRLDDVRALGYSEEFIRMWTYYLCYCEAAFEERATGVVQIQFDKPGCRRDPASLSQCAGRASRFDLQPSTGGR